MLGVIYLIPKGGIYGRGGGGGGGGWCFFYHFLVPRGGGGGGGGVADVVMMSFISLFAYTGEEGVIFQNPYTMPNVEFQS